jgi:hypothetical protein
LQEKAAAKEAQNLGGRCLCYLSERHVHSNIRYGQEVRPNVNVANHTLIPRARFGTTKWKGDPLFSGYRIFTANKEIELDAEIPASKVPEISGSEAFEDENLQDEGGWETAVTQNTRATPARYMSCHGYSLYSILAHREARLSISEVMRSPVVEANSASASKKFIPPSAFYGKSLERPKKGPL